MAALEGMAVPVFHAVPLWKYYKRADALYLQAMQYQRAGKIHEEYQQLFAYASLIVDTIPKHKDFKDFQARHGGYRNFLLLRVLPRLETLKPLTKTQPRAEHARRANVTRLGFSNLPQVDWVHSQPDQQAGSGLTPADYLEQNSTVMRAYSNVYASTSRPAPPPGAPGDPFAASALYASNLAPPPPPANGLQSLVSAPPLPDWAADAVYSSARPELLSKHSLFAQRAQADGSPPALQSQQLYPSFSFERPDMGSMGDPPRVLALPPQELEVHNQVVHDVVAPPPGASCDGCAAHAGHGPQPHSHAAPAEPPPPKLGKRTELRDVYIAPAVMASFMHFAQSNTRRGVESCGILAGLLSSDDSSFTVTTLIIPKQRGEANTVEMINEEEVFEYQFARELMPLGWIHTHPTQTCFLSSVDVHTHCGYQVMLSEAVAIVMAPTDPRQKAGIFRLTTPGGMAVVQGCEKRGFHQHEAPPNGQEIYELCGHVFLDESAKYESIDLR